MQRHELVQYVNRRFEDSFRQWRKPRSIGLRLVSECMRKTIMEIQRSEPPEMPDTNGMYYMSYGSAYETWILERFKSAGILKYNGVLGKDMQVNVRIPELNANGYMDALVVDKIGEVGVEVKSCNSRAFDILLKNGQPAKKEHFYQLMIYLHFLKIPRGMLVYIDRDKYYETTQGQPVPRWEILEIKYDKELGNKLERRLRKLSEYYVSGEIPEKEPKTATDERCRYCAFKQHCWGNAADSPKAGKSDLAARIAKDSQARKRKRSVTS